MDAAYSVQWYNHSTKFKKMLQMVIMRAQRPCLIYMGPLFPVTMEHFQNVSHMSLSPRSGFKGHTGCGKVVYPPLNTSAGL